MTNKSKKEIKLLNQRKLRGRRNRPNPHGRKIIKTQRGRVRGPGRRHQH